MRYWKTILACLGFTIIGLSAGTWWAGRSETRLFSQIRQIRVNNKDYKFIQPLLAVEFPESMQFREYTSLENKIQDRISTLQRDQKAQEVAVYFRDLRNGHWVGINENDTFAPASLLKLPVLIAYLKQAESEPEILKKKLLYAENSLSNIEENQQEHMLISGREYTVEELLANMIIYSDNNGFALLMNAIDRKELLEVFTDLGIQYPGQNDSNNYFISAKTYSLFFRILRNATILNREASEVALQLLNQTTFNEGLVAGVPRDVAIAHKFGIYSLKDQGRPEIGLHDCGIIYVPETPYILCVMTRGNNLANLKESIKEISGLVYSEVK